MPWSILLTLVRKSVRDILEAPANVIRVKQIHHYIIRIAFSQHFPKVINSVHTELTLLPLKSSYLVKSAGMLYSKLFCLIQIHIYSEQLFKIKCTFFLVIFLLALNTGTTGEDILAVLSFYLYTLMHNGLFLKEGIVCNIKDIFTLFFFRR